MFRLLKKYRVPLAPYQIVTNGEEALKAAKRIGFPVVVKALADEISHKTNVGAVKLGLSSEDEVRSSVKELLENFKQYSPKILVQKMVKGNVELFIGGKRDPLFGPMVLVGLGGIYVELFKDISARLCPVSEAEIREMLQELRGWPLLKGYRGKKGAKIEDIVSVVRNVCRMMEKERITELDFNPVICSEKRCVVVDARVVM